MNKHTISVWYTNFKDKEQSRFDPVDYQGQRLLHIIGREEYKSLSGPIVKRGSSHFARDFDLVELVELIETKKVHAPPLLPAIDDRSDEERQAEEAQIKEIYKELAHALDAKFTKLIVNGIVI